jgi:hypothetical protein
MYNNMKTPTLLLAGLILACGCLAGQAPEQAAPAPQKLELRANLAECSYVDYPSEGIGRFRLFFKVWNAGEIPTKQHAAVCLSSEKGLRPHCINLNEVYHNGQVLWNEINWTGGRKGQEWTVENRGGRSDGSFRLYYTEDQNTLDAPATTIYEGRTEDCKTDVR